MEFELFIAHYLDLLERKCCAELSGIQLAGITFV